jgi:hypothetical protein
LQEKSTYMKKQKSRTLIPCVVMSVDCQCWIFMDGYYTNTSYPISDITSVNRRIHMYLANVNCRKTDAARAAYSAGDSGNQRTHHNLPPELHTPRHHDQRHNKLRPFSAIRHQMQLQTMFFVNY